MPNVGPFLWAGILMMDLMHIPRNNILLCLPHVGLADTTTEKRFDFTVERYK